jgi:DNA-binding SARP family transcriptional activator
VRAGAELPLGGPRHRKLLAVLLLNPDELVPTDRLVDALWGESPPRSARDMLHVRVSELRTVIRPGRDGADRPAGLRARAGGCSTRPVPPTSTVDRSRRWCCRAGRGGPRC